MNAIAKQIEKDTAIIDKVKALAYAVAA